MKLQIFKLEEKDLITRVRWFNSETIYSQMAVDAPLSLGTTKEWYKKNLFNNYRYDFVFCSNELPLAMGGLLKIDRMNSNTELYILTNPDHHSKGIGKVSTNWLCEYAFKKLNLEKVYLYTLEINEAANHVYKKLGFIYEGTLRKHQFHNGKYLDKNVYSILKTEWYKINGESGIIKFEISI